MSKPFEEDPPASDGAPGPGSGGALPRALGKRFILTGVLGQGGYGVVYAGLDADDQAPVAIKMLMRDGIVEQHRLFLEYQYLATVARAHDERVRTCAPRGLSFHSGPDGTPFLVMERLLGFDCERLLAMVPSFPVSEALQVALAVARAARYANSRGLAHRDIKPGNVMVVARRGAGARRVVLIDPGLAREQCMRLTRSREFSCTPGVTPPEILQCRGGDERTDTFMIAALLLRLTTNREPFEGATAEAKFAATLAAVEPPTLEAFEGVLAAHTRLAEGRSSGVELGWAGGARGLVSVLRRSLHPMVERRPRISELIAAIEAAQTDGFGQDARNCG